MSIKKHAQKLSLDPRITLFDVDLTSLGGGVQRFTPMSQLLGKGLKFRFTSGAINSSVVAEFSGSEPAPTTGTKVYVRVAYEIPAVSGIRMSIRGVSDTGDGWFQKTFDLTDPDFSVLTASNNLGSTVTDHEAYNSHVDSTHGVLVMSFDPADLPLSEIRLRQALNFDPGDYVDILEFDVFLDDSRGGFRKYTGMSDLTDMYPISQASWEQLTAQQVSVPVLWRGNEYTPIPVEADGFEVSAGGNLPRPKMRVSNVMGAATQLANQYQNLQGAEVTRWRTFYRFLDTGLTPDPNAYMPLDVYSVDRKVSHNRLQIEWELASILDQQGSMLPGRQVIRSGCQFLYRRYDGSAFDYSDVTCPYVGAQYFRADNTSTADPSQDRCSQTLKGCLARFGDGGPVPFGGFPSVGRIRR